MPEVLVNGARFFYEEMGSGPGTIVFSHSYLVDSHHFAPQMQLFLTLASSGNAPIRTA
jgi:pimeloyl-ACP methyl ester carboxylesterase